MKKSFICFVSRDKELAERLIAPMENSGMTVEPIKLRLGDRPVEKIKEGFSHADSGSLLLSPAFFKNPWPRSDLDELAAIAQPSDGRGLSIIWADIDANLIASYSPALARITGYPAEVIVTSPDEGSKGISNIIGQLGDPTGGDKISVGDISVGKGIAIGKGISFEQTGTMRSAAESDVADSSALYKLLITQFTESDLRDMAFDLGVDYENFEGDAMNMRVLGLVSYMRRRGRMDELAEQVEKRTYRGKW